MLDRLAEIAQARIGADITRIWLLDDAGTSLELRAQTGVIRGTVGLKQRLSPHDSVAGWVMAHMEPLCIADVPADTRLVNRAWLAVEGVVSVLSVPIMLDDQPIGILACLSRTRREFTPGDVALARALTAPAVVAVRNAALTPTPWHGSGDRGVPARGVGDLVLPRSEARCRAVVRELHGLLHSDAALCTHVDPQTRRLRMLTGIGTLTDGIAGYEVKAGQGVAGLVLKERRSVRSEDYLTDPRFTRSPAIEAWARAEGIVSIIGAPILDATGEFIAFLWAFNRTPRPFTARHEATMVGLAQQAALAVGQARSVEEERRRARQTAALLESRARDVDGRAQPILKDMRGGPCRRGADGCACSSGAGPGWCRSWPARRRPCDSALGSASTRCRPRSGGGPPPRRAIRSRQPVIVARGGEWQHDAWFRAFDLTSALVVPLVSQDQVVGTMTLVHRRERRWRQDQLDLAMTIAAQIALAVDTARHYQAAQQRTAEVETGDHRRDADLDARCSRCSRSSSTAR